MMRYTRLQNRFPLLAVFLISVAVLAAPTAAQTQQVIPLQAIIDPGQKVPPVDRPVSLSPTAT